MIFSMSCCVTGKSARVGASVDSLDALEAALSIPALTMLQAPLEIAESLPGTAMLDSMRQRNIGLFVREILRKASRRTDEEGLCLRHCPPPSLSISSRRRSSASARAAT